MDLKLIPVTKDNWRTATFLTTDPERKAPLDEEWITNNAFSLLQCQFDPNWDCRILADGDTAVGFVFYGYDTDTTHHLLCRYMIDVEHQGKGYGKAFLPMVVDLICDQFGCRDLYTSVHDDNARALHLYTTFGFERTDEMDADERFYILRR